MAQQGIVKSLVLSFRPKTLTAALVPVIAATALAIDQTGAWNPWVVFWALTSSLFIQIGTNLINDWADFEKGTDNEKRIGPRRASQSGWMSSKTVFRLGIASFVCAVGCGLPLVLMGGWPIVGIGILALIFGYAYTAGPFPLAYHGWGDFFVIVFFGVVAVMGTFFLHTGDWSFVAFWLGLQIGLLATALIAINNLRDVDEDAKNQKRTLAVRLGKTFVRFEIATCLLLPFAMNFYYPGLTPWVSLLLLPLAAQLVHQVFKTEPSPLYNGYLAKAAGVHLLFGVVVSVLLIW